MLLQLKFAKSASSSLGKSSGDPHKFNDKRTADSQSKLIVSTAKIFNYILYTQVEVITMLKKTLSVNVSALGYIVSQPASQSH